VLGARRFFLGGLLAMLAAGCQNGPRTFGPTLLSPTRPELTTVTLPEPLTIAAATPLPSPPLETNGWPTAPAASVARDWPSDWENAWVPLESWGQFNGLAKPQQLTDGPQALYQLNASNGLLLVKVGSHTINFGGLQYGLGFAPRLFKGLPYVHSLDARKTLQTLLGPWWTWPATNRTIVLDPGHGGRDSGALCGPGCGAEKHYTLDWALRLAGLLAAGGWNVVLTRTNDTERPLAERVAVADRAQAALFLSLHFNSAGANRDLAGLETYCLTPTGLPSNLTREYEDDPRQAHPNNQFDEQNMLLASRLHRAVLRATGATDRGVLRARFMTVLQGQHRPAVLIEGGYLTHPDEARRIATAEYRQALAEGVARGLESLGTADW
jgi:N-acetylmuramoyl-L-alanine amidase